MLDIELHNPECFANHMGIWAIQPSFLTTAVSAIRAGLWQAKAPVEEAALSNGRLFHVGPGGQAVIPLVGALMKGDSKFGGSSTVRARQKIRAAVKDPDVTSIMIHIDSPGGHVAGTFDLAADIRAADKVKPVFAHIDDLGASAAFWAAVSARRITANTTAQIGSIGTVAVVHDLSAKAEKEGVTVHVISTGEFKGAFAPGAPVPAEHLQALQERIDGLNEHFLAAVAQGRNLSADTVRVLADGRVHIAATAVELGLIDAVSSFDDALEFAQGRTTQKRGSKMSDQTDKPEALTLESFSATHPDIAAQIRASGVEEGAKLERERIQAVAECSVPGFEDIVSAAMYDGKSSARDVALKIVAKSKEGGGTALKDIQADAVAPVADGGEAATEAADADAAKIAAAAAKKATVDFTAAESVEDQIKAMWENDEDAREEFNGNFANFKAYTEQHAKGNVRIFGQDK